MALDAALVVVGEAAAEGVVAVEAAVVDVVSLGGCAGGITEIFRMRPTVLARTGGDSEPVSILFDCQ